jgi:hypothetical protein
MVTKQTKSEFQNDSLWRRWIEAVESVLRKTAAWRLKWVLWGMLFAAGRKTISSWIRAAEVQARYPNDHWKFKTKLELGKSLVLWAKEQLSHIGLPFRVVVDGGYAKSPFVKELLEENQGEDIQFEIITRLRRDAMLYDLPPTETRKRRGRKRIYGVIVPAR